MEPLNVLCIGNSFSQDATTFLHPIAKIGKHPLYVRNLYIGGCSLERHAMNVLSDNAAYEYQTDGIGNPEKLKSIRQALEARAWDVVTVQQVSYLAGIYETYAPFLWSVLEEIRHCCPQAKIYFHGTWAYEKNSSHAGFAFYGRSQAQMHQKIQEALRNVSRDYQLPILNSGKLVATLRRTPFFSYEQDGLSLCRDGFHMSLDYGRYALGLLWYRVLAGETVSGLDFMPDGVDPEAVRLIQDITDCMDIA